MLRVANSDRKYISQKLKVIESKNIAEEIWEFGKLWRKTWKSPYKSEAQNNLCFKNTSISTALITEEKWMLFYFSRRLYVLYVFKLMIERKLLSEESDLMALC